MNTSEVEDEYIRSRRPEKCRTRTSLSYYSEQIDLRHLMLRLSVDIMRLLFEFSKNNIQI
eukprot:scaffold21477_cov30-Prasinocladus_malaysianus.AAC.1